jgi:transcriptional regulator with XRE-family HTH domain
MDNLLAQLTDDTFEQELIESGFAQEIEPDDPQFAELDMLSTHISALANTLPYKQRTLVPYIHPGHGYSQQEMADKAGCSVQTVSKARNSPTMLRIMALQERTRRIYGAPAQNQRIQMAWRIAKRNEKDNPNTSLKALDVLNKQAGDYSIDLTPNNGVTVNIKEFTVSQPPQQPQPQPQPQNSPPIDAEFTPVTVQLDGD